MMADRKHLTPILVADDDATIRANLALLLRSEGYDVREAIDGLQAAEFLRDTLARAAILAGGRIIQADDLQAQITSTDSIIRSVPGNSLVLRDVLAETERRVILQVLEQEGWNRTRCRDPGHQPSAVARQDPAV